MKKLLIAFACLFSACSSQKIDLKTYEKETTNTPACTHPQYIVTVIKQNGSDTEAPLSFYNLTKDAQSTYGGDVTIQNVRYDLQGGKKVSVVYDVIRCDTSAIK